MWDCEAPLRKLASHIEPSAAQKAAASRSEGHLRALLQVGQFGGRIVDVYLIGSYARDTAVSPIDDVDVLVVVDPKGWPRHFFGSKPEPDKILQSFARAIRYRYPNSSVHIQRRSVCLTLNHLYIDVVPAIELGSDGDLIQIPDADSDEWITSAPKRHTAIATEINRRNGGRFKPIVKLLKYWNHQLPQTTRLNSFAIETLAGTLFRSVSLPSSQEGLRLFYDFLAARANGAILYKWPSDYGVHTGMWSRQLRLRRRRDLSQWCRNAGYGRWRRDRTNGVHNARRGCDLARSRRARRSPFPRTFWSHS